ncbi:MAG: heme-binding protein [Rhizobiales bacterium]|nr:heme-binding protein [Hyphomicrobiales bacterium]
MSDNKPQGPLPYGPSITLEEARRVMEAAEAEARANGWPMVIAIVDTAGLLVMFHRMDNTQTGSVDIGPAKARTAALFKRPTRAFEEAIANGGIGLRMLSMTHVMPLEGGLPIERNGAIIGGIGVSGMSSPQDAQVARAGLAAL